MEHPPIQGTPLAAAADNWESEGGSVKANPATTATLRVASNKGIPASNRQPRQFDEKRTRLRALVATIDSEIMRLPLPGTETVGDRRAEQIIVSWKALVSLLALGPAPETRECPVCAQVGMRNATRCWSCWTALQAPAPAGSDAL